MGPGSQTGEAARPDNGQRSRTYVDRVNAAGRRHDSRHGAVLLPSDPIAVEFDAAAVLASLDTLLIEELSEDEDEAFAAALDS